MNIMNLYVYENRSMSNDLSKPIMLENLNVDNVQIHIPKEIDGTDMGTWAWWFVYQNAKREKYSIPMTIEGVTNDEGEEEYISTVGLNHGFTGKHGSVMYAIEAVQADGSGAVTHEWHTRTYKLEIVHTLQGNQTEYSETESDIISALISRVNELITSGAEIAEIAATIENAAETAQEVIDSIPPDYSELSNRVGANTIALAEKADQATTYTKKQVDQMIADVEVETDTTLSVSGAPADAKKVGDELSDINESLDALDSKVDNVKISDSVKEALLACFEHVALWTEGDGQEYIEALHTALGNSFPDLSTGGIVANYYYDASGNKVASNHAYCNEKYFEIENGTDYYWIQGFNGSVDGVKPDYTGSMNAYRVCYYDENKNFISRQINDYSSEFGIVEPRYMKLTIPTGAKYFRVSWTLLPCGVICRTVPSDLYAVTIVLANLDDSEISDYSNIVSRFSVTRKGTDITQLIKTGIPNVTPEDSFNLYGGWLRNIFNVNFGGSPEYGDQNLETMTRIHNKHTYIMRKGDVISFNNVKAGVRAERISDGDVQHTTAWITDNSDFVIGGES